MFNHTRPDLQRSGFAEKAESTAPLVQRARGLEQFCIHPAGACTSGADTVSQYEFNLRRHLPVVGYLMFFNVALFSPIPQFPLRKIESIRYPRSKERLLQPSINNQVFVLCSLNRTFKLRWKRSTSFRNHRATVPRETLFTGKRALYSGPASAGSR